MLIRELLEDLRAQLSDEPETEEARCWSDEQLLRIVHGQMRGIATELADSDGDFYCCELELFGDDATRIHQDLWAYELPPFVHHVTTDGVRLRSSETEVRGRPDYRNPTPNPLEVGWLVDEDGTLRRRATSADDLIVRVAKMPARPFWATLTENSEDPSRVTLPLASSVVGGVHVERDSYAGMRVTCASQPAALDQAPIGEIVRVVSSRAVAVSGSSRIELILARPFSAALGSGAVLESIVQVPEFALGHLLQQSAMAAMSRRNRPMTDGLDRIVRAETARFLSARHRDESGPKHFAPQIEALDWRRRESQDYFTD